jgi:diacylglycerol kinase (ATP)
MAKRIIVIANPAAGQDTPVLGIMNRVFQASEYKWDVWLTKQAGDGHRLATRAIDEAADIVAVYGGDGSVREVASALAGSDVALAILPGGTANVMSVELGIPAAFEQACQLAVSPDHDVRTVDMGKVTGEGYFILRIGIGLEAAMVEGADRSLKDRIGSLAYALSAFQALQDPPISRYTLTLDDQVVESEGLTCLVCNSGSIGQGTLGLGTDVSVSDGLLDVFVLRKADLGALVNVVGGVLTGGGADESNLQHWKAKKVRVEADPPQNVQADGETLEMTPVEAEVVPGVLKVIVPKAQ